MAASPAQTATEFSLRSMTLADVPAAYGLTQQLGWPYTEKDWAFHLSQGRGWVVTDSAGAIIGTTLLWFYGDTAGTLGLVIVDEVFRGKGVGRALMEHTLEEAGDRKIWLVATEMAVKLYQELGFTSLNTIEQRQGILAAGKPLPSHNESIVRAAREDDYDSIRTLDRKSARMDRSRLIDSLLTSSSSYVLEKEGRVIGSVLVRESGRGKVFGPLITSNQADAKLLLSHALSEHPGFCRIDVPEDAGALGHWLDQNGLPVIDRGTLMQNSDKEFLRTSGYRVFSLISQGLK